MTNRSAQLKSGSIKHSWGELSPRLRLRKSGIQALSMPIIWAAPARLACFGARVLQITFLVAL
jgi:hypothetical protein